MENTDRRLLPEFHGDLSRDKDNKSSAVAEMGDRGHNTAVPISRTDGTTSNTMWPVPRSSSVPSVHPSSHLATIHMGQKLGGAGCALFSGSSWIPIKHKVA